MNYVRYNAGSGDGGKLLTNFLVLVTDKAEFWMVTKAGVFLTCRTEGKPRVFPCKGRLALSEQDESVGSVPNEMFRRERHLHRKHHV